MSCLIFAILITFFAPPARIVQFEPWNGLYPLRTTRTEVVKNLGPCSTEDTWNCQYDTIEGRVFLVYSAGTCGNGARWKVPSGTVTDISYYPKEHVSFSDSGINISEFEREEDPELPGIYRYFNSKKGFSFVVEKQKIKAYYYSATDMERKQLACGA